MNKNIFQNNKDIELLQNGGFKIRSKVNRRFYDVVKILYDDLREGQQQSFKIEPNIRKIELARQIPLTNTNSLFLPNEIKEYIIQQSKYIITYEFQIKMREIKIIFITFEKPNIEYLNEKIKYVYLWLYLCDKYSNTNCMKSLKIEIYLTPLKKELPDRSEEILGTINANTGFSGICLENNVIIVYRKEEWFKVLIHETMHAYDLTFMDKNKDIYMNEIKKIFSISHDILLYESYCEIWARIMNIMIYCFMNVGEKYNEFLKCFIYGMEIEGYFSLYQMNKILKFMDLTFNEIINHKYKSKVKNNYREKTNIFAYYIITAILLNNYEDFMIFCNDNNKNTIKIEDSKGKIIDFIDFIENSIDNKIMIDNSNKSVELLKKNIKENNNLIGSMRMTIMID